MTPSGVMDRGLVASGSVMSHNRNEAITWINVDLLSVGSIGRNFSEIVIIMQKVACGNVVSNTAWGCYPNNNKQLFHLSIQPLLLSYETVSHQMQTDRWHDKWYCIPKINTNNHHANCVTVLGSISLRNFVLKSKLANKDFSNLASGWLAAEPPANQKPC